MVALRTNSGSLLPKRNSASAGESVDACQIRVDRATVHQAVQRSPRVPHTISPLSRREHGLHLVAIRVDKSSLPAKAVSCASRHDDKSRNKRWLHSGRHRRSMCARSTRACDRFIARRRACPNRPQSGGTGMHGDRGVARAGRTRAAPPPRQAPLHGTAPHGNAIYTRLQAA